MKLLALVLVAACGGTGADDDGVDGAAADARLGADAGPCGALDGDPAWLDDALEGWLGTLAGMPDRASAERREATRDFLVARLAAAGIPAELHDYGMGANVVARLPGDDASAGWVLIGAHFDSVSGSPGANDNASGVVTVLATAQLMLDTCRQRGVIVAFFDQEEIGLIGSTYLADDYFQADENIVAVHTVDQVGWDDDGDRVFEIELPTNAMWLQYQSAAAALGFDVSQTATSGTDHQAFRNDGFPAAGVTEEYVGGDTTPYYHQSGDTFATVDRAYTRDAVRLVSRVIAEATN